jgi:hypothetical protein
MVQNNDAVSSVSGNHFAAKMIDRYSGTRGGICLILGGLTRAATSQHKACEECGKEDSFDHTPVYNSGTFNNIALRADWLAR